MFDEPAALSFHASAARGARPHLAEPDEILERPLAVESIPEFGLVGVLISKRLARERLGGECWGTKRMEQQGRNHGGQKRKGAPPAERPHARFAAGASVSVS